MKAIIHTKYGGPEVLELKETDKPAPSENEVLVKVHSVSINDWDWGLFNGNTFVNRVLYGLTKPKRPILGSDIAGIIETVGKSVKRFKPGDKVFGDLSGKWGGFAEYVCAREDQLAIKPDGMSFDQAAAIPQAGMLAVQGLIDVGKIQQGQKLLINGAGGGVGTFAIQIAQLYGAEVTVVDNAKKFDMLRTLGVNRLIDYTQEDFTKGGEKYDLILDVKTNRSILDYMRALRSSGAYVTVGGDMGRFLQALLLKPGISLFSKKKFRIVVLKINKDLGYMSELFQSGKIKPVIDGPFKLEDVPEAFRIFGKGEHKGKIVIRVAEDGNY